MNIDIAAARARTPGCRHVVHLDSAGSSLPSEAVVGAVKEHLDLETRIGGYAAATEATEQLNEVYTSTATMLGCDPHELAFAESATRAWWAVFESIPLRPGDRILTTHTEYISNMFGLLRARDLRGVEIEVVPDDPSGEVSVDALTAMLDERVKVVCVTHVPTSGGLVQPAARVGAALRDSGAIYLLDACQSVGQMELDVTELGCDMMTWTGRKYLRAPRGTGMLYVRANLLDELLPPPTMDGVGAVWTGPMEYHPVHSARRYETFETGYAAKIGLGVATREALDLGLHAIEETVQSLAENLRTSLGDIPGVEVRDLGTRRSGIVTFTIEGHDVDLVVPWLRSHGVNTTASRAPSSRLDLGLRDIPAVIRASVHYYNDASDLDHLSELVDHLARRPGTPPDACEADVAPRGFSSRPEGGSVSTP